MNYNRNNLKSFEDLCSRLTDRGDTLLKGLEKARSERVKQLKEAGESCKTCRSFKHLPSKCLRKNKIVYHYNICHFHKEREGRNEPSRTSQEQS